MWVVRLSKLYSDNKVNTLPLQATDIHPQIASVKSLGKKIDDFKKQMPEFNFYFDMPEGSNTMGYSNKVSFELTKKLGEVRQAFEIIKSRAKVAENEGDYKTAIEAYEKMIIEECEDVEPYERLIIIFSKLKWRPEEISVIERAIAFFDKLKEKQLEYVNFLAEKYGMVDKAQEYISKDKKIYYYFGAFELYNPQATRLNKWYERLQKIKQKA
jgi:tetratricopeptide (TPR) repeat protein